MKPLVFWIPAYAQLGQRIANELQADMGKIESKNFPDGERYLRLLTEARNREVILVGGTINDSATLDLFDLACAIAAYGAISLKIVLPFYGYSTMEREVNVGEVVTAKTRARILSAIPQTPMGNQLLFLDLHSEGLPFYFEGPIKTRHLYAKPLIIQEAKSLAGDHFTLGSVDAGRAKWVESLANDMCVPAGFVYKRRDPSGQVSIAGVNISVQGQKVVIYDDMIRSGGSLIQAAEAYHQAGATKIWAITTHGLFTHQALDRLEKSGLIESIVCTDSHATALVHQNPFLKVVSTASLFAQALKGDSF